MFIIYLLLFLQVIVFKPLKNKIILTIINLRNNQFPTTFFEQLLKSTRYTKMRNFPSSKVQNPEQSFTTKNKNLSPSGSRMQQHSIPLDELMLRLSDYRQLKQLPLNPVSETKEQLWRDSPCTVRCTNRHVSLDKIQRFRVGSIYHKDNIHEQKKIFTESEKPQLMLKNFRRQIQEATHSKRKYSHKSSKLSPEKTKITKKLGQTLPLFQNKLYQVPEKIDLKFDRNGSRSTYVGEYDVKRIIDKLRTTANNFTSSRRVDLALPLNFNPGPGEYFSKSDEFMGCLTYRSRKESSRIHFHPNTQRQNTFDGTKKVE